jgi:23S rRNA (cytidine1920-2'-O)/16S rRNA (cytidine1409-2'-O)-methyltransferase
MEKERLDNLVQRQTGVSRSKAQGLIHTGHVFLDDGTKLDKPGMRVDTSIVLDIREGSKYVSRGGDKLAGALAAFDISVEGVVALDAGASTGGFSDCLLKSGAAKVYAVDVGYGQLAWEVRQDARVVVMERQNVRHLTPGDIPERPTFFTVDCSFISLALLLPPIKAVLALEAEGVILIKPQFEAGKDRVGKGGVVRDPAVHEEVIDKVVAEAEAIGFTCVGVVPSPLLGPAGNREFLAHLRLTSSA